MSSTRDTLYSHISDISNEESSDIEKKYKVLKFIKSNGVRRPDIVCYYGKQIFDYCMKHPPSSLSTFLSSFINIPFHDIHDNKWNIAEQICMAAMDAHLPDLRNYCLTIIEKHNKDSLRAVRLRGLVYESAEQFPDAITYYKKVLIKDPSDLAVWKRLISMYLHTQNYKEALTQLVEFVDFFPMDLEVREQLCFLYNKLGMYNLAVSSAEDLVLLAPSNHFYSILLADNLYADLKYDIARQYYCQAFELHHTKRAAIGIMMCIKSENKKDELSENLLNMAISYISTNNCENVTNVVNKMLVK